MLDLQNDKTSLRVGFVNERGIITSAYIGLKVKNNYSSKYFYALLNHLDLIKHFYNGGGGVRQSVGFSELGKERITLPPLSEQTAIANFLDYKTAKIDRFIQKKKQLIKLLNEQKAGIINDAVTKGLNPNAKMKPSGIEWLGDIPEHWEVRKLKYVAKIKTGRTPKIESSLIDFFENAEINWFTLVILNMRVF
jgi:type I restriction enzyme S subunit